MNIIPLFEGFDLPQENWSKLPHAFIEALPQITSLAEMKVILYILRHTWGYREFDDPKTITADEFAHGRKYKDGSRIDNGIGMGEPAIRAGLKNAVEHGFINVDIDDRDKARIEKSYKLAMKQDDQRVDNRPSGLLKSTPGSMIIDPRSEKETVGKKKKKETVAPIHPLIQIWATVRGIDAVNIGAPIHTAKDTACAKRMAKWAIAPTQEEITLAIRSSKASKSYAFTWLEKDIAELRLQRSQNPPPVSAPPPSQTESERPQLSPEQAAQRQRDFDRIMGDLLTAKVEKAVA